MRKTEKKALITGITGQDGSYLSELLIEKGYLVYGMVRRSSVENFDRIEHIKNKLRLIQGDLTDQSSLDEAIKTVKPDEVCNLGAQSFVPTSWNQPVLTADVDGLGVTRILGAIKNTSRMPDFFKPPAARCSARFVKFRRPKRRRFTLEALMGFQNPTATTLLSITGKVTTFSLVPASRSTTSLHGGGWNS
jgi:GDPmannose 4,6-dehydratase